MILRSNFGKILLVQLRLTLLANTLVSLAFLCAAPLALGLHYLNARAAATVLERYCSLIGIILLTPIFYPEDDKGIRELVRSKASPILLVNALRIVMSIIVLFALLFAFALALRYNECSFPLLPYWGGTVVSALFLGAVGLCAYAFSDNLVVGYMAGMGVYALNMFVGKKLGMFWLFSLIGESYKQKPLMLGIGLVLIVAAVVWDWVSPHKL